MNDSTRVMRRSRRAWPRPARTAAAIIATAALAGLAAACSSGSPSSAGSGGSPDAGGSANSPSAVGYSHCMRSHGVPNYPDPDSSGVLPKVSAQELGVSSSQLQEARRACQKLLPNTGGALTATHGVPNWPDPTTDSEGRPYFDLSANGFSRQQAHSPQIRAKVNECEHEMPSGLPEG